ncbi:hypothetical protein C8F01DRAFT_1180566 [Mycena amicta]|nr:hypothetical protein C8F01DRAFT_1180566 [Mycena amicta]
MYVYRHDIRSVGSPQRNSSSHSMDTLVNPRRPTVLSFAPNSMIATTISSSTASGTLYTISTGATDTTTIKDTKSGRVVAKISKKMLLPDTVSFADSDGKLKEVKLSKWMREVTVPGGRGTGHVLETADGIKYSLQRHVEYRLALFPYSETSQPNGDPIAYWRLPDQSLVLDGAPEDSHLQILVAFMIAEQKMRMEEKSNFVGQARMGVTASTAGSPFVAVGDQTII